MGKFDHMTPGPWQLGRKTTAGDIEIDAHLPGQTALVHIVRVRGTWPTLHRDANAALVAAAPQLLEFAQILLDMLVTTHYKCSTASDTDCYQEQYGDGNVDEHATIRELEQMLYSEPAQGDPE